MIKINNFSVLHEVGPFLTIILERERLLRSMYMYEFDGMYM